MSNPAPSQTSVLQDKPNPQLNHTALRELHGGKVNALTDVGLFVSLRSRMLNATLQAYLLTGETCRAMAPYVLSIQARLHR